MRQFGTWSDVVQSMRRGGSRDEHKNEILRVILERHARDRSPMWRLALVVMFLPGLSSLGRRKRHWDPEQPDELTQRILAAFLHVVCRIDVNRRADSIAQRLYCGTLHRVYEEYQRTWRQSDRERATDPEQLDRFGVSATPGFDAILDARDACERAMGALRARHAAGLLSTGDLSLLSGRDHGEPLVDYAHRSGVPYQTFRKRWSRAVARVRQLDKG
jgi:hypothetical protein